MERVKIEAAPDHVKRLAGENDPVRGLIEIIWNSLDADADNVIVEVDQNELGAVEKIVVRDDGHGIPASSCKSTFKLIGGSWKKNKQKTLKKDRSLHGKLGHGRIRAFSLGSTAKWETVADEADGIRRKTVIDASVENADNFNIGDITETDAEEGTVFTALGSQSPRLNKILEQRAEQRLVSEFAPYLLSHRAVQINFRGRILDPESVILEKHYEEIEIEIEGEVLKAVCEIFEWSESDVQSIYLCEEGSVPIQQVETKVATPGYSYSAYLSFADMAEHLHENLLEGDSSDTPINAFLKLVRSNIKDAYKNSMQRRRVELVWGWQESDVYPYEGEPAHEVEQVERATFDAVATAISRHVPKNRTRARLTLSLLKESLRHDPAEMQSILVEVLRLSPEERDQLGDLLRRTSLSKVIRASSKVDSRLTFLAALEHMVYDPEAHGLVLERDHLHKILEKELWVFGEQYNMMLSERSLTAVLDRHKEVVGFESIDRSPVIRGDGTSGRFDLLLSAAATEHDRNRHLIVELKAPRVVLKDKEFSQIKSYAKAVARDPRFAGTQTNWDFILIGSEMDDDLKQEARQRGKPRGLAFEPEIPNLDHANVRVWLYTWGEVIEEAKRRLSLFKESLNHDASTEDVLDFLNREYSDLIPPEMRREIA